VAEHGWGVATDWEAPALPNVADRPWPATRGRRPNPACGRSMAGLLLIDEL